MAIYADTRGGTLIIDRRIQGQRFKRTTGLPGTRDGLKVARQWDGMLTQLAGAGRLEIVRLIQRGELTFEEVWKHHRVGQWDKIPDASHLQRLFPVNGDNRGAVGRWLPTYRTSKGRPSKSHLATMRQKFMDLEKLKPDARTSDLPRLVRIRREQCEEKGHFVTFNRTKAAVQTFLRSTQGRHQSTLWAQVADIPSFPEKAAKPRPCSPAEARRIRDLLPGPHGDIWWGMCLTGMMPDEYLNKKWEEYPRDRVEIHGTKRTARERIVFWVAPIAEPLRAHKSFANQLERASKETLTPYDARHTLAHWMLQARIDPVRRELYLGHGSKTMKDIYEWHDVEGFLAEDGEKFAAYVGPEPT